MLATHLSFTPSISFSVRHRPHHRIVHHLPKMSLQHTRLTLPNPQSENLVALLTTNGPPPQPLNLDLIVLCHGFQDSKNSRLMTFLSETLPFATVRIDFSGNGESEGDFRFANYLKEVSDLRALIIHLRSLGARFTTLVGHSKGGGVVLLYAAQYGDVPNVVNLAARYDMRRGIRERFGKDKYDVLVQGESIIATGRRNGETFEYRVTSTDLQERLAIDMEETAKGISSDVKVLTVHGSGDEIIPVADAHEIHRRISNGQLVLVEGSGHSFKGFEQRVVSEIEQFVNGQAR